MMKNTIHRAKTIVKREEVKLIGARNHYAYKHDEKPLFLHTSKHFQVKQRNGEWVDVWFERGMWSCNAVTDEDKNGKKRHYIDEKGIKQIKKWGCVMNTAADKTKPFCSHTLACQIYLDNLGVEKSVK